ncbi:MAG: 3'-5' exonuclease domain-containing protein 2 [Bacteroidales bacterium]|nr:3'-5' exonuclease domain-containing protein 2 [Bacteroidales bacterium]
MVFRTNITEEEINDLPLFSYSGEIVVVDNQETYNKIREELFLDKIWGFDTETKPCFKKGMSNITPVSLLQLSSAEKTYLFRLNKFKLHKEVIRLLSSTKYTKIGVSIRDDLKSLQKLHNFTPGGFIELQEFVKDFEITDMSLKKLAAIVLGIRISKAQQLSNWENDILTQKQISYAATDSWISREIYIKLKSTKND